jgi:Kef-type K+ transport system membrane component KefB
VANVPSAIVKYGSFFEHLAHEFALPLQNPVLVFCVILFIILLAPLVLRQFRVPGVIGLIISGVIMGPHALNVLEKNSAVELFSTIGLLYIMFIAGLELDMDEFRRNRNKSLLFGLFTFAIPMAIGYPACRYLLQYGESASLLTASMFATHTLVAYPIVSKFGLSRTQVVAVTVGGTILTDTAVLLLFAVIMGADAGGLNSDFWIRLGSSMVIFLIFMFAVLPRIARWFFGRLESEKTSHYVFVLAAVFFAAFMAEVAGVEPIIGAFVAGLALNRLIPHSSALMNRLEFVGNALFIPFFLISVGMIVDVRVLAKGNMALLVAGVLTVVALAGKWLAALLTQLVFRYTGAQRQLIFGLSSSHAAATLAIILVGFQAGIIDENILNGTVILILVTCLIASFATDSAARKIVMAGDGDQQTLHDKDELDKERILIPCDEPAALGPLLDLAVVLRDRTLNQPLTLVNVVENDERAQSRAMRVRGQMNDQVRYASASETPVNTVVTIDNNIAGGIIRIARETFSNVLLLGWSDHVTLLDRLFGPKMDSVIRNYDKLVLVTRMNKALTSHRRMVLLCPPLAELEAGFGQWLGMVHRLSRELGLRVDLIAQPTTHAAIVAKAREMKLSFEPGLVPLVEDGDPAQLLADHATPSDLIVLVSARPGSLSYTTGLDMLPRRMDKQFQGYSVVLIYPATIGHSESILELT